MSRHARMRWLAASAAAVLSASPRAHAFDRFWNSFTSGNFADAPRWIGNAVPGAGDTAIFRVFGGTPGPYSVTFRGNPILLGTRNYVNQTLRVGPNTVSFFNSDQPSLSDSTYTLSSDILIGEGTGPAVLNTFLPVSSPAASIGAVGGSSATLNINASTFNVTGSGAGIELLVGEQGPGTLTVNAGAHLNLTGSESNAVIGSTAGVSGAVNVTGAGAIWNHSGGASAPLFVGGAGNGSLTISAGGRVNNFDGLIADDPASVSFATVTGAGSTWVNGGVLSVGSAGAGSLTVADGGAVFSTSGVIASGTSSSGFATVTGANSTWTQSTDLTIGSESTLNGGSGPGTLRVLAGGRVNTDGNADVGPNGAGTVFVAGPSSTWAVGGELRLDRTGSLAVSAGGSASANTVVLGNSATVAGAGSTLTARDVLTLTTFVFATNTATLTITDGGRVDNRVAFVAGGSFGGGLGAVNVDGPGSTFNTTDVFYAGFAGLGNVTVTHGAQLNTGAAQLGVVPLSLGAVTVDGAGSAWNNGDNLYVGVAGTARVTVSNGGLVNSAGPVSIGPRGVLEGNSTVNAATVQNGGTVAPGLVDSATHQPVIGTLRIAGNYSQAPAGHLAIDLASQTSFDKLQVTGTATLAGSLDVIRGATFVPLAGDRYTILTAASRTGEFQPTAFLNPPAVLLVPVYTPTEVFLLGVGLGERTWGVDASGNASVGSNWIGGVAPVPGGVDEKVAFTTMISANRTVTVDAPFTVGTISFDDDNDYLLQGPATITLQVSSSIALITAKNAHGNGQHTISAPLQLNSLTGVNVSDPNGTLRITGQITAAPGVAIGKGGPGTLAVRNVRMDGLVVTGGTVRVLLNGTSDGTSILKALSIATTGRLNLEDNDLLVTYTGATPYATIRDYVIKGLTFNTAGIISSAAQAAGNTVHAVVDNANLHFTSWEGTPITDATIIVKYTLRGDATLDGSVNFNDLVKLAQNYNNTTGTASWDMGDFNYDGNVDFNDLVGLAQNYNAVLPAEPIPGSPIDFSSDLPRAFATVPEPAALGTIMGCGFAGLLRRRRRA